MQRSWFAFSLVILLSVFCFLQPVKAQQVTAAITGTVVDPAGAPINGATVTARDTERGTVYTTKTITVEFLTSRACPLEPMK